MDVGIGKKQKCMDWGYILEAEIRHLPDTRDERVDEKSGVMSAWSSCVCVCVCVGVYMYTPPHTHIYI